VNLVNLRLAVAKILCVYGTKDICPVVWSPSVPPIHNFKIFILPSRAKLFPRHITPCKFCFVEFTSNKVIAHILHKFVGEKNVFFK